jgi:hypothetical protein
MAAPVARERLGAGSARLSGRPPVAQGTWTTGQAFQGNFVQKLDLPVSVGEVDDQPVVVAPTGQPPLPVVLTSAAHPPSAAVILRARDLLLVIEPAASGYRCTVLNDGACFRRVVMPVTADALADAVRTAHRHLLSVITATDAAGDAVFQTGLDIPPAQHDDALRRLARAGAILFQKVFFPLDGGADLAALGNHVRELATRPTAVPRSLIMV